MQVTWTIQGESGASLGATSQTLEEYGINQASVSFRSLDIDLFRFAMEVEDHASATLPDIGQTITLFRDGTRFFHGHVTSVVPRITAGSQTITVEVAGPWWWMERVQATSIKADAEGNTKERPTITFGTSTGGTDLRVAIDSIIDRSIQLGVPMSQPGADYQFSPNPDNVVRAVAVDGSGNVYVGGDFANIDGTAQPYLAKIDSDGEIDGTFAPTLNGPVHAIVIHSDGDIVVAGTFTSVNSTTRNRAAKLATDGTLDSWDPNVNGPVYALAEKGTGDIVLGGDFAQVSSTNRQNLAVVATDNTLRSQDVALLSATGTHPGAECHALAVDGSDNVYIGGTFRFGKAFEWRTNLCRMDSSNNLDTFTGSTDDIVRAVALRSDGKLVAGGDFLNVGSTTITVTTARDRIALFSTASAVESWDPGADGSVYALVTDASANVFVAGDFTELAGASRARFGAIDSTAEILNGYRARPGDIVRTMALDSTDVIIGGDFEEVGGVTLDHLCKATFDSVGSEFFDIPRTTLNLQTCGQTLTELVRLVPDAMTYFDYSTPLPTLYVVRRDDATVRTITLGTSPVESLSIRPVYELKVEKVVIPYVTRATDGRNQYQELTSGTAATGRIQMIPSAGPELDTFLPDEPFDTVDIYTPSSLLNELRSLIPDLETYCATYGTSNVSTSGSTSNITSWTQSGFTVTSWSWAVARNLISGHSVVGFERYGETITAPDWCDSQFGLAELVYNGQYTIFVANADFGTAKAEAAVKAASLGGFYTSAGFYAVGDVNSVKGFQGDNTLLPAGISSTPSAVYRAADYSFIEPPPDFAENLLGAQNWVPHEGEIVLTTEDVGGTRYAGAVVNVSNSLASYSSMKALVAEEVADIASGRTEIRIGAPPRVDLRTFVQRIRRTPQDNIYYN